MSELSSRGTLTIDAERCKGCELCIPACRPGVLAMSSGLHGLLRLPAGLSRLLF